MEVTKKDLLTIIHGVATSDTTEVPEVLRHVRIEPGRLVATDGRILIVREVLNELKKKFEPFCVSVPDIKGALKANAELWPDNGGFVPIDPGDEFMAKIGNKRVVKQDGEYVDWARVLVKKDKPGQKTAKFGPELMMKALRGLRDAENAEFRIWDEKSAARLDAVTEDGRKVMILVMPIVPR